MRDLNKLISAFGQADDGFKTNVYRTLASLQRSEEKKIVKKLNLRVAIVAAVVCVVMVSTTALALTNTWGIMDFLTGFRTGIEVLPDAEDIIQKEVPQEGGESEMVAFSVREAIFDGQHIYIVAEARPTNSKYLLLGTDAMPSDPASGMGVFVSGENGTIKDYARKNDKTMLRTWVGMESSGYSGTTSISFVLESDGTLVYMLSGEYDGGADELNLALACGFAPFLEQDGKDIIDTLHTQKIPLAVTLHSSGTTNTAVSTSSAVFEDCGVRVDAITLTSSPMSIYAEIEFTVINEEKYAKTDGGLWFEFLDENGERLPDGADSEGYIRPIGGADSEEHMSTLGDGETRFLQKTSIQAAEFLPDEVILRGYNAWEKTRYETHAFEMK